MHVDSPKSLNAEDQARLADAVRTLRVILSDPKFRVGVRATMDPDMTRLLDAAEAGDLPTAWDFWSARYYGTRSTVVGWLSQMLNGYAPPTREKMETELLRVQRECAYGLLGD